MTTRTTTTMMTMMMTRTTTKRSVGSPSSLIETVSRMAQWRRGRSGVSCSCVLWQSVRCGGSCSVEGVVFDCAALRVL